MFRRRRAFTLAELLTVLAILLLLAGILFPVVNSVKEAGRRTSCFTHFHQTQLATYLYVSDYDDRLMPVSHRPGRPNPRLDRTWVQLTLPYVRSFEVFKCPSDSGGDDLAAYGFDPDLTPSDVYAQYYEASMHVNMGYNYLYLAPVIWTSGRWASRPRTVGEIAEPSRTLLFVDSVWNRDASGAPVGGGSWLVVPPCRYFDLAQHVDSFGSQQMFTPVVGWDTSDKNAGNEYGNAWPWHNGRISIAHIDGSVTSLSPSQLTSGCTLDDGWKGTIDDSGDYMWDLN